MVNLIHFWLGEDMDFVDYYGEDQAWSRDQYVFCEYLRVRSAKHNWSIEPHRHQNLLQIFVVLNGSAKALVDDKKYQVRPGQVLIIKPLDVHAFQWREDSDGYVLSIDTLAYFGKETAIELDLSQSELTSLDEWSSSQMQFICESIIHEQSLAGAMSKQAVESMIKYLMIILHRQLPATSLPSPRKSEKKFHKFKKLLSLHCYKQHQVAWYAQQLAITTTHLNRICKECTGETALSLIHAALLEEAKRNLLYADLSIASISERLGFDDPSYFNKFFKRLMSVSPRQFRSK